MIFIFSLREISAEVASVEPLAHHCKLFDIYPKKDTWETGTLAFMAKILEKYATIYIFTST